MSFTEFGYGMGFFGWLFMIIFWIALIWFILWLLKRNKYPDLSTDKESDSKNALEILKERYARGEITKKEYEEMKKEIKDIPVRKDLP
jgi:putative membrane protein